MSVTANAFVCRCSEAWLFLTTASNYQLGRSGCSRYPPSCHHNLEELTQLKDLVAQLQAENRQMRQKRESEQPGTSAASTGSLTHGYSAIFKLP